MISLPEAEILKSIRLIIREEIERVLRPQEELEARQQARQELERYFTKRSGHEKE